MILITGGLGFIGSHIVVELLQNNYQVVVVDNLSNSKLDVLKKIELIVGTDIFVKNLVTEIFDVKDENKLDSLFKRTQINKVIHCAGLKAVGESVKYPLMYYHENINGLLSLIEVMSENDCFNLIFSSSATVYGSLLSPLNENDTIGIGVSNPYGQTKFFQEQILKDLAISSSKWNITALRYFNPIGAHPSGLLGEDPNNHPNNLMPYLLKVCVYNYIDKSVGNYPSLNVFGKDYDTNDGTAERDYIHVVDVARAHVLALNLKSGYQYYNIGTGKPTSVLELINSFQNINNLIVPYIFSERRQGDLTRVFCDNKKALDELKFKPEFTIEDMVRDSWNFVIKNKKFNNLMTLF